MGLAAVAVASSAMALTVNDLPDLGKTNALRLWTSYSWPDPERGGLTQPASAGSARSQFGAEFAGPTTVTSLTIEQMGGYAAMQTLWVYADGVRVGTLSLPNDLSRQTYEFADYLTDLDGKPLSSVPVTWGLAFSHRTSWPGANGGITYYAFNGTPYLGEPVNPNLHTTEGVIKEFGATNMYVSGNYPLDVPKAGARITDGILNNSLDPMAFWEHNNFPQLATAGTEQSFTVFYNDPQTIASIGLAFMADDGDRATPNWVTISGSQPGQVVTIMLDQWLRQYNRYNLTDDQNHPVMFEDTLWLKITFPPAETGNYSGTATVWGLLEFQAFQFATSHIPEPATMTLLALGGLALRRRT